MPRQGVDRRGSSRDRARRKEWLLRTFGDGTSAPCTFCAARLTKATVEADRITPGGSYRRENIQPACRQCNVRRGTKTMEEFTCSIS
jgi:5-methylcytosine-specific restriction endonuclease McrA